MGALRVCGRVTGAVVAVVLAYALKLVVDAGQFKTLVRTGDATCRRVRVPGAPGGDGLGGFEDLAVYRTRAGKELVLTGSDARHRWFGIGYGHATTQSERIAALNGTEQGAIYAYDPSLPAGADVPRRVRVVGFEPPGLDWHPHGLASRQLRDGSWVLFVVNHRRDGDAIEVLTVSDSTNEPAGLVLTYQYSVVHPLIRHANDVVVADASGHSLYVTNWYHYEKGTAASAFEAYAQRAWGSVVYCTALGPGSQPVCNTALAGLKMANGLALTSDDTTLYVAASIERTVRACSRTADGRLHPCDVWHVNTAVDNLLVYEPPASVTGLTPSALASAVKAASVDPATGLLRAVPRSPVPHVVLGGCHPQMLSFVAHEHHPTTSAAPSEVIAVRPYDAAAGTAAAAAAGTRQQGTTAPTGTGVGFERVSPLVLPKADAARLNFSASSVAGYVGGRLILGAVFQSGLLVCDDFPDPYLALANGGDAVQRVATPDN